jgi:uncharacterized protein YodC (DUF2158 family)
MAGTFKVGDWVKLAVGGPVMAVSAVLPKSMNRTEPTFRCQWFAGKKLDSGDFPLESLVACSPSDTTP